MNDNDTDVDDADDELHGNETVERWGKNASSKCLWARFIIKHIIIVNGIIFNAQFFCLLKWNDVESGTF